MRLSIGVCALFGAYCLALIAQASELGEFALRKILRDGRDILGDVDDDDGKSLSSSSSSSSSSSRADWMAGYADSTPLARLNIPGTHDAATWNYSQTTQDLLAGATRCDDGNQNPNDGGGGGGGATKRGKARVYQCQKIGLVASLERGIRFFDLRFAMDPTGERLVFWHGPALLSVRADLEGVLLGLFAWLEGHATETVLVSLQYERNTRTGARSDAKVQRLLVEMLTSEVAGRYIYQGRNVLGTLGETRGKIVLLRRFDVEELGEEGEMVLPGLHLSPKKWTDNSRGFELAYGEEGGGDAGGVNETAFIEDYYYPDGYDTVQSNIGAKFEAVRKHLERAAGVAEGKEKRKKGKGGKEGEGEEQEGVDESESLFITFTSGTHVDTIPPVYPDVMALGVGRWHPEMRGVNARLLELLGELKGKRLGVVVMDFFEEPGDLVGLLLGE